MKLTSTRLLRLSCEAGRDGALRRPRAVEARSNRRIRLLFAKLIPPADTRAGTAQRAVPTFIPIRAASEFGLKRSAASAFRRGFSVLEIMVAVALLAVIIVGLLAMFYQVQRAFRAGTSQVDVMEGGRAAISIITREMQEVAAAGIPNVTNLAIVPSWQGIQTAQVLSSGTPPQPNYLDDFCFLQRRNDEWTGIAYRFTNAWTGVGTLVRYSWSWPNDSNPIRANDTNMMMSGLVFRQPPNPPGNIDHSQVLDGVVHFQIEVYDADGVLLRPPMYSDVDNSYLRRDNKVRAFMSTNLPAYLDLELRVLEPATLAKFRARAQTDFDNATNYLARQIGHTHVFRQRIPVRTAGTLPF